MRVTGSGGRDGITRVDVIVCIFIAVFAIGLFLPLLQEKGHIPSARSVCMNNLKQVGFGVTNYCEHHHEFPPGAIDNASLSPEQRLSWMVTMLPYLEREELYQSLDLESGYGANGNAALREAKVLVYQCRIWKDQREIEELALTSYVGVTGIGLDSAALPADHPRAGLFGYASRGSYQDMRDGVSNTLMVLTTNTNNGPWYSAGVSSLRSLDTARRPYIGEFRQFGGTHFQGCYGTAADGSVRSLEADILPDVFEALMTINGGESVSDGDW